jgi:bacterioferritin-associated ferredoxin
MIVCHCNVLTREDILSTLDHEPAGKPRTPAQAYKCLGCAPDCGRCLATVKELLIEARGSACGVGCPGCPGHHEETGAPANDDAQERFLVAAE